MQIQKVFLEHLKHTHQGKKYADYKLAVALFTRREFRPKVKEYMLRQTAGLMNSGRRKPVMEVEC